MPKLVITAAIVFVLLGTFVGLRPAPATAQMCFGSYDPDAYSQPVICPGPAASIVFEPASLLTTYCGSQSTLSVVVKDAIGNAVVDGTQVSFTTDGGRVGDTSTTRGGLALTTFSIHPDTTGVARVVATVDNLTAVKEVHVGCVW